MKILFLKEEFSMAQAGDTYSVILEEAHLKWGTHRHTNSRDKVYGEGYIKIPSDVAYSLELLNSNGTSGKDIFGQNLFYCKSKDGMYQGILRAQGNQNDTRYAKQFSADNDLKAIGSWYSAINAVAGDVVQVTWKSSTEIIIEKL